jgi:hypothetical protein
MGVVIVDDIAADRLVAYVRVGVSAAPGAR